MRSAFWFVIGFLLSSWVSCAVCYFAGRAMLADLAEVHTKTIDAIRGAHTDLIAFVSKWSAKASEIGQVISK